MTIQFPRHFLDSKEIVLIAPSGCAIDLESVERGIACLESAGFVVHSEYSHEQRYQRFGGKPEQQLSALYRAAEHPSAQIVLALRGSYGISRYLKNINFRRLAESGKLFIGHSDFNALQLGLLAQANYASLCGPMLCNDFSREYPNAFMWEQFQASISCSTHHINFAAQENILNPDLDVYGTLWGGNLAMFCHLLGTAYLPQIKDGILFFEDIAEHPYRVERMLLQLLNAGILDNQRAIVLGDFSSYKLSPYDQGFDFAEMLSFVRSQTSTPILTGLPFGHVERKTSLMMGSTSHLHSHNGQACLSMTYL
jgi:muramoyltetrapeptide carboxypeptidase